MKAVLRRMLDESEFLSDYGIRAVSRYHLKNPYNFYWNGNTMTVDYEPAESTSGLFGGNSNWRGPIWFPVNFLIIESLQKFHHYYGDDFKIEYFNGDSGRAVGASHQTGWTGLIAKIIQPRTQSQTLG
jgi:glycogen debranching enzyme